MTLCREDLITYIGSLIRRGFLGKSSRAVFDQELQDTILAPYFEASTDPDIARMLSVRLGEECVDLLQQECTSRDHQLTLDWKTWVKVS